MAPLLSGLSISEDGLRMAYGLSTSGSDWQEWKVRDVETGEDLPDHLKWISSLALLGLTTIRAFLQPLRRAEVTKLEDVNTSKLYHQLGKPQSEDVLI